MTEDSRNALKMANLRDETLKAKMEAKQMAMKIARELADSSREIAREPVGKIETTNLALIHIMLTLDEILLILVNGM